MLAAASTAWAGAPLVTDDAAVLASKTCQLETWIFATRDSREYWALPACNFTGNLELAAGGARTHADDGESASVIQLQAKTVLFATDDRVWSFGAVGGGVRDTGAPHGRSALQTYYAKALASWYPRKDLEIDLNLGAANAYGSGTFALAGASIQYSVVPSLQLLAETFHDEPGTASYQIGARWLAVPNRFEAYVSYANRFHGAPEGWSAIIGIRLQTPDFLP